MPVDFLVGGEPEGQRILDAAGGRGSRRFGNRHRDAPVLLLVGQVGIEQVTELGPGEPEPAGQRGTEALGQLCVASKRSAPRRARRRRWTVGIVAGEPQCRVQAAPPADEVLPGRGNVRARERNKVAARARELPRRCASRSVKACRAATPCVRRCRHSLS